MTNRTFLTYHFYTKKRGKIITFLLKKLEKNIDFYTPLAYDTINKGTG